MLIKKGSYSVLDFLKIIMYTYYSRYTQVNHTIKVYGEKMAKKEYFTIPQLAKLLGVTRMAIYKKVISGKIKAIKIGRNYAISKDYFKKHLITNIVGRPLSQEEKEQIEKAVEKIIKEYGEVLKLLGNE